MNETELISNEFEYRLKAGLV